ncbi:MAG: hypothetical protein U1F43_27380 [Myxococcota bacterium]
MRVALTWLVFLLAAGVARAETWAVFDIEGVGVDAGTAHVFQELLAGEIGDERPATFVTANAACQGDACVQAAAALGADRALYGSVSALGSKVIVNIYTVDVKSAATDRHTVTVDRIEDLDVAAKRIGRAIARGETTAQAAELGTITHEEAKPDVRRDGASGLGAYVGGVVPFGAAQAAGLGVAIDASYWFETRSFAIEPRLGVRFAVNGERGQSWVELPIDIGLYWLAALGDVSPFLGGGVGVRYAREVRAFDETRGDVLPVATEGTRPDSGWGPGIFARAGVMLLRTYTVRVAFALEAGATFVTLHGHQPRDFTFTAGVYF